MAEEKFELFHYTKKLPTKSDEKTEWYNRIPVYHTEKGMYTVQILTLGLHQMIHVGFRQIVRFCMRK